MSNNRSYIDPNTAEVLLLTTRQGEQPGWYPAVTAMSDILAGITRLYRTTDTDQFVTVAEGELRFWPQLSIVEEPDVRALIPHPWIADGSYGEGLTSTEVSVAEMLYSRLSVDTFTDTTTELTATMETALRPLLDWPALDPTLIMIPSVRIVQEAAQPPPQPLPLPKHVAALVIDKAVSEGAQCPITMETLTKETAAVTSCGHVFQTEALRTWLTARGTCPECRQVAVATAEAEPKDHQSQ
jgi:hypothetical protein